MDSISIEEFSRVELRVATILSAEPHPRADRLLVLSIDLGDEQRQIVAGIRQHYRPEDLPGKQIVVVVNLAPAVLRGVESQGMLLAASHPETGLALVTPDRSIPRGSRIR